MAMPYGASTDTATTAVMRVTAASPDPGRPLTAVRSQSPASAVDRVPTGPGAAAARPTLPRTDFSRFPHAELCRMLYAGSPHTVTAAGDAWATVGRLLHDRASDLEHQISGLRDKWSGAAAEQYKIMMSNLAADIRRIASTALAARDIMYSAAEALQSAQERMPAAVQVPTLTPAVITAAAAAALPTGLSADSVQTWRSQRDRAVTAVHEYQRAQAVAAEAHDEAVQIMAGLAAQDNSANSAMPTAPTTAARPTVSTGADGSAIALIAGREPYPVGSGALDTGSPGTGTSGAQLPLFGRTFAAGLDAALAALGGRFSGAALRVINARAGAPTARQPRPAGGSDTPPDRANASTTSPSGLPPRSGANLTTGVAGPSVGRSVGSGSVSFGGGGGGTVSAPTPTAAPGLGNTPAGVPADAPASGAAELGATTAGAARTTSAGYMPAMPYGMMGGADPGGGMRRLPAWLVETEDVWGESAPVAPSVIGEDPSAVLEPGLEFDHDWR